MPRSPPESQGSVWSSTRPLSRRSGSTKPLPDVRAQRSADGGTRLGPGCPPRSLCRIMARDIIPWGWTTVSFATGEARPLCVGPVSTSWESRPGTQACRHAARADLEPLARWRPFALCRHAMLQVQGDLPEGAPCRSVPRRAPQGGASRPAGPGSGCCALRGGGVTCWAGWVWPDQRSRAARTRSLSSSSGMRSASCGRSLMVPVLVTSSGCRVVKPAARSFCHP